MWLLENNVKHRECRVFNRCSQATLGAPMDEGAFCWTKSAQQSSVAGDGVVVFAGTVRRVCGLSTSLRCAGALPQATPTTLAANSNARSLSVFCACAQCMWPNVIVKVGDRIGDWACKREIERGVRGPLCLGISMPNESGEWATTVPGGLRCAHALLSALSRCWSVVREAYSPEYDALCFGTCGRGEGALQLAVLDLQHRSLPFWRVQLVSSVALLRRWCLVSILRAWTVGWGRSFSAVQGSLHMHFVFSAPRFVHIFPFLPSLSFTAILAIALPFSCMWVVDIRAWGFCQTALLCFQLFPCFLLLLACNDCVFWVWLVFPFAFLMSTLWPPSCLQVFFCVCCQFVYFLAAISSTLYANSQIRCSSFSVRCLACRFCLGVPRL